MKTGTAYMDVEFVYN